MYKLSIPKLPRFINRTVALVVCGVLIFSGVLAYGIVRQQQMRQVQSALDDQKRAEHAALVTERDNLKKSNEKLQYNLNFETAKSASICDWVRTQAAAKKVITPQLCK